MGELSKEELEELVKTVSKGKYNSISKEHALIEIVQHIGLEPETPEGKILSHAVEREIKVMKKIKRKTGENYAHHTIFTAKEAAKLTLPNGKKDMTMVIAALFHDDIEELRGYKKGKRQFEYTKKESKKEEIVKGLNEIRNKYVTGLYNFFEQKELRSFLGVNVKQVCDLCDMMTKRHDEYYYEYLERIFGRKKEKLTKYKYIADNINPHQPDDFLLNVLRMSSFKTAGDRVHNTSTIPRKEKEEKGPELIEGELGIEVEKDKFTIPQRLKECYKSMMTINRTRNLLMDFEEEFRSKMNYSAYFDFLRESEKRLTEVSKKVITGNEEDKGDKTYLTEKLLPIIGERKLDRIDALFSLYTNTEITKPADEEILNLEPEFIFDGTLARYDDWIMKIYRWGITKPEDIPLNPTHKKWMRVYFAISSPDTRALLQEYMDALVFESAFERFQKDPNYTLKKFKEIKYEE